ncbi:MAG: class I SAM-dependent methyltransferase [Patescibacteria group bacterium]
MFNQVKIIRKIDFILTPLYKIIPYTHYWQTLKAIGNRGKTLLDVACGDGQFMTIINSDHRFVAHGADIFDPYIKKAKQTHAYAKIPKADIRKLNFPSKSFDLVLCSQAIEHLTKKEGFALMKTLEKIAKKRVIFITPAGHMPQDPYDGNTHQKHKSEWKAHDFSDRGYIVTGQGLKFFYGSGNAVKKWGVFSYLFSIFSLLAGPVLKINPDWGVYLFCWKDLS